MNLKSGYPFWPVHSGLPISFPPLLRDASCDVLIVGAGITGALIAHALSATGMEVMVVDQRDVGWGSTSASTALLQYEIDTELNDLVRLYGEELAVLAYRQCEKAIHALAAVAAEVGSVGFKKKQSLYFSSHWHHAKKLRSEGALRQRCGFDLEILDRAQLRELCGIRASAALLTKTAAQVDPYRMTYAIFRKLRRRGVGIFDRSAMLDWRADDKGVAVRMAGDVTVRCRHLVLAAGYEAQKYLPVRVARNRSSYATVTEPIQGGLKILSDLLVWESARPYMYLRSTSDGRALIGGEDDSIDIPLRRDAQVLHKSVRLMKKLRGLFPDMRFEESFAWAGTFAETKDGLPFFGPHPKLGSRIHFAMAYGGNGITYSSIGADILVARLTKTKHPLMKFFSFDRCA